MGFVEKGCAPKILELSMNLAKSVSGNCQKVGRSRKVLAVKMFFF